MAGIISNSMDYRLRSHGHREQGSGLAVQPGLQLRTLCRPGRSQVPGQVRPRTAA